MEHMYAIALILLISVICHCYSHLLARGRVRGRAIHLHMAKFSQGPYIPDGLTAKQWADIKLKEKNGQTEKGDLGALGIQKFKSRSMQAFQESVEKGEAKHLYPVDSKTTPIDERPYMMRYGRF